MKKILYLLLIIILISGCNKKTENNLKIPINEDKTSEKLILSQDEIEKYNEKIAKKTSELYNLEIESLKKSEIEIYLNKYPTNIIISNNVENPEYIKELKQLQDNINYRNIKDTKTKKALTINKTVLKAFPTSKEINQNNLDINQQTEIHINTPVLIIHESLDKQWSFVITEKYIGWIATKDIVEVTNEQYNQLINNEKFAIITDHILIVNDIQFDMGTKLPYKKVNEEKYLLQIPTKNQDNQLIIKEIEVNKESINIGYLKFTNSNILLQAQKYKNTPYSYGGKNLNGIDCSGFINNVFATFGFKLPRNTLELRKVLSNPKSITSLNTSEKINTIKEINPLFIFSPSHIILHYEENGKNMLIHASVEQGKVTIEELSSYTKIEKLDLIATIN